MITGRFTALPRPFRGSYGTFHREGRFARAPAIDLTWVSLCVQYGVSKGTMAWTLDVSRTCDKFWFGVTTDKDLDCNGWISDCDAAFMVSEEGEVRLPRCHSCA